MAQKLIDTTTNNGSFIGDPAKTAFGKINENFSELYSAKDAARPVSTGGTGATTSAGARANLGVIGAGVENSTSGTIFSSGLLGAFVDVNKDGRQRDSSSTISNGGNSAASAAMGFVREGAFGVLIGLDAGNANNFCIGGWSMGNVSYKFYHEGNTTKSSGGVLSAASPVVRLVKSREETQRPDVDDSHFEWCGCGTANDEARGVMCERLDVGVYQIHGSLGLATDYWHIQAPQDANGNYLCFVEATQAEDKVITIRTFRRVLVDGLATAGDPMDIPVDAWVDVRMLMPERVYDLPEAGSPVLADPATLISARRYQMETAGISVSGLFIDTSRDSQALITGAALSAFMDNSYTCNWKTDGGFVQLSAQDLIAIAKLVRAHVQACFDREADLLAAVKDGSYTAAMLEEGWPA